MKLIARGKVAATLDSRNFLVNLITLFLLLLATNDAEVDTTIAPEIVDSIFSGNYIEMLMIIVPSFLNPIIRIVRNGFDWAKANKMNVFSQAGTVLLIGLTAFGMAFPEGAVNEIVEAIFGGELGAILAAIMVNFLVPLWHFFRDRVGAEPKPVTDVA